MFNVFENGILHFQRKLISAGECWAFEGGHGQLKIKLAQKINVTAVSYEHLPLVSSTQGNIMTAPKDIKVWVRKFPAFS